MIEYKIRTPFRIAAWFPALAFVIGGVAFIVLGLRAALSGPRSDAWAIILGIAISVPGLFFLRIGWTGRVPAFAEEYGLDGPGEVEESRSKARSQERLYE